MKGERWCGQERGDCAFRTIYPGTESECKDSPACTWPMPPATTPNLRRSGNSEWVRIGQEAHTSLHLPDHLCGESYDHSLVVRNPRLFSLFALVHLRGFRGVGSSITRILANSFKDGFGYGFKVQWAYLLWAGFSLTQNLFCQWPQREDLMWSMYVFVTVRKAFKPQVPFPRFLVNSDLKRICEHSNDCFLPQCESYRQALVLLLL